MNTRDIELLSAYLDGQLSAAESARLEARLPRDPQISSAMTDLRYARALLRQLPSRKAPRNFTLTRSMVKITPPLPRAYSIFQFSSAFAAVLLFFAFAFNMLAPRLSPVSAPSLMNISDGQAAAPEAAAEAPALAAESTPQAKFAPTQTAEDAASFAAPLEKTSQEIPLEAQTPPAESRAAPRVSSIWLALFAMLTLLGAGGMFLTRRAASKKWK